MQCDGASVAFPDWLTDCLIHWLGEAFIHSFTLWALSADYVYFTMLDQAPGWQTAQPLLSKRKLRFQPEKQAWEQEFQDTGLIALL